MLPDYLDLCIRHEAECSISTIEPHGYTLDENAVTCWFNEFHLQLADFECEFVRVKIEKPRMPKPRLTEIEVEG